MSEKDIVCPKCGSVCKSEDIFCFHCGYNLSAAKNCSEREEDNFKTKYCPKCGKAYTSEQNYCSYCGYSFINKEENQLSTDGEKADRFNKLYLLAGVMLLFGTFVYLALKFIGSIPDEQIKANSIKEEEYSLRKAKGCHENEVKDTALKIFKENDYYFRYIDPATISDTSLKFPVMDSYNSETDKYYCRGTVFVIAASDGFAPANSETGNHYYDELMDYDSVQSKQNLKKYTRYLCEINYASQISQNQVYVTATACGNGNDFNNKGKFTYTIIKPKPKPQEPVLDEPDVRQVQELPEEQAEAEIKIEIPPQDNITLDNTQVQEE